MWKNIYRGDRPCSGLLVEDSVQTLTRKSGYMAEAQARYPFPTPLRRIPYQERGQLVTMVKERCSRSKEAAAADVGEWMQNKVF